MASIGFPGREENERVAGHGLSSCALFGLARSFAVVVSVVVVRAVNDVEGRKDEEDGKRR